MMKPGFQQKAELRHLGGKHFQLLNDLYFWSEQYQREFKVPAGTITDLASIPWFAQSFCQVLGNNIRSAILHDYNCRPAGKIANQVSQRIADNLFREGLALDNVRWTKARIMFRGVRVYQKLLYRFKRAESYDTVGGI